MSSEVVEGVENVSLEESPIVDTQEAPPAPSVSDQTDNEEGIPDVSINGKSYKPLADGDYDVIVLSTGLEECVLAGLLSVRGMRVLQVDRNAYYGGECSSLNLKEMFEKHQRPFDEKQAEGKFGKSRSYCVDSVPKLLMSNGVLVKMLIQTGVTRYIDFGGIDGSFVYQNNGKVYKLPVTPTEALTSSLVSLFQKNAMRKFAEFLKNCKIPKRVANTLTKEEFKQAVIAYYQVHNQEKLAEVDALVDRFDAKRDLLVSALEKKYGMPVIEQECEVEFGPGSLGMRIEGTNLKKGVPGQGGPITRVVTVTSFLPNQDGTKGSAEASGKIAVGDIINKVNGEKVIGLSDKEIQQKIVSSARPLKLTFIKPAFDASVNKYDLLQMTAKDLYTKFGLDDTTINFVGHAMALHTNDKYLDQNAEDLVARCQLYGRSMGRFAPNSPYIYPLYGLSSLPEAFSRLSAVYGGVVMLRTDPDEILFQDGKACGIRVGDQAAKAKFIIGNQSYFPPEMSKKTGKVIRSVCILNHQVPNVNNQSTLQIILPAKHLAAKAHDVYLSVLGPKLNVVPKGITVAIASTRVETSDPQAEVRQAIHLLGDVSERFDTVTDSYEPVSDGSSNNCFIVKSLDETSHFETAAEDIQRVYRAIFKKDLNLDEKLVPDQ